MNEHDEYLTETSDCCGAPVHPDIPICSACKEWCEITKHDE